MNSFRCSNCSLLNFDTANACKRCGMPFNPEAEAATDAQPYAPQPYAPPPPPEGYPQPAEGGSYYWDQPNYQPNFVPPPPPQRPSSSVGAKLAGIMVFVASAALVAFVAMPRLLKKSGKADLSSVTWSEYKAKDGSYSVSLPATPKESKMSQPSAAGTAQVQVVTAEIGRDAGCMVMHADFPAISEISEDTLYEQTVKAWASPAAGKYGIGARKFITQDGHRGLEVEFKPPMLEKLEMKGRMRVFWIAPKLYMVMAAGPETPEFDAVGNKCLDSFKFSS